MRACLTACSLHRILRAVQVLDKQSCADTSRLYHAMLRFTEPVNQVYVTVHVCVQGN